MVGSFGESDAQLILQVVFEGSVVGFRCSDGGFDQHPSVDGQPSPVKGLDLVGDGDVGVQIGITGAAVAMGERCRNQTLDVHLPHTSGPLPGEQGMLLDEDQGVAYRRVMGAFDHGCDVGIGYRP